MDTSVSRISSQIHEPIRPSYTYGGHILTAISIITLIGALVVAGYYYGESGTPYMAIGGALIVISILSCVLAQYCAIESVVEAPPLQEHRPQPVHTPPTKTSLPSIFELPSGSSKNLLQALPRELFLKQDNYLSFRKFDWFLGPLLGPLLDHDLLDIPLKVWITRDATGYEKAREYLKIMNDPPRAQLVAMINARIEELDHSFQLKKRVMQLDWRTPPLIVHRLLPAWSDSILRFALLRDDEIRALTAGAIAEFDADEIYKYLDGRIFDLSYEKKATLPSEWTQENIEKIPLIDMPKLTAADIHKAPTHFPLLTFLLIGQAERMKIDTARLSTKQVEFLLSSDKSWIPHNLTPAQVNAAIPLIKNKSLFKRLSEEQILGFDYSQIDRDIAHAMFDTSVWIRDRTQKVLPKLSKEQKAIVRPLLSAEALAYLKD